ncbi:MAG: histidine--tRNA ligase [Parachlamydiales bacterium]
MAIPIPKGVFDLLPDPPEKEAWKGSAIWQQVERAIREQARLYGYREIRTPVFERTELFARGVGAGTDIVSKEMYTFEDKGGRSMSLRPEGTAPVIRSFLENHLEQRPELQKLYYLAPMFRYERQQAGRYRQHHQFGVEVIGGEAPELDAEIIDLLLGLYQKLGLKGLTLHLSSLGDSLDRIPFRKALVAHFTPHKGELSADSQERLQKNPLRILDSKAHEDQALIKAAPSMLEFLSPAAARHFEAVQQTLKALGIPFEVNRRLVRGLDYYNRTVFEITASELGAQNSIGGGGRYDGLLKTLGGPDLPAIGFGAGVERLIQTLLAQQVPLEPPPHPTLLLIPVAGENQRDCFLLASKWRREGVATDVELSGKRVKGGLRVAEALKIPYVVVIGDEELKSGRCVLKQMETRTERELPFNQLTQAIRDV